MSREDLNETKLESFMMKVIENNAAAMSLIMCALGDRLGLFRALAAGGPATSSELAVRAEIDERYAREWLAGMYSAGYLELDAQSRRYVLPPEHALVVADEGNPYFLGAFHQHISSLYAAFEPLAEAFRTGEGIAQDGYSEHFFSGLERNTSVWVENFLVQWWLELMPEVKALLESGSTVVDVGCDSGLMLIKLARHFSRSQFTGYDISPSSIERAAGKAGGAGLTSNLSFEVMDITKGFPSPGEVDVITCIDVLHDTADPLHVLQQMHGALNHDGYLLLGEYESEDDPRENTEPLSTIMYGFSITYCVPTTLSAGGEALGTLGLPPAALKTLCLEAGFSEINKVPTGHPLIALYLVRP